MSVHLGTTVTALPGIGEAAGKAFHNLGVKTVRDLLFHFPYRYEDYSKTKPIPHLRHGDTVTLTGRVTSISSRRSKNRRVMLTEAVLENATGAIAVVWFNQPYLEKTLARQGELALAGTVDMRFNGMKLANPIIEPAGQNIHTGRIVPIYGLTGSLTLRRVRQAVHAAFPAADEIAEWLPEETLSEEAFPVLKEAVRVLHAPPSMDALTSAVDRLKFDELFLHQLMFSEIRRDRAVRKAHAIRLDEGFLKTFVDRLPFKLTGAQRRAAWEIVRDLAKSRPMNRLLEGDVGSGKTVVAAMAAASVVKAGKQAVYLAPTEILASQQHRSFRKLLPDATVALLTRSFCLIGDEPAKKEALLRRLSAGEPLCVIGTHALLQDAVCLPEVALVIVDEQHRFGVRQRHELIERRADAAPHLLSMTATPIPRSLALTLYGDLDLSILNELPAGRRPIATRLVTGSRESAMFARIREEIERGRQIYVVCPLIDPSDSLGVRSVKEVAEKLGKGPLKGAALRMLHGQMKSEEKEHALNDFSQGKIDVLVSTTVVEVGMDVPNATVMLVVGAERFGLSQLHQLRGRVGRSEHASYCFLWPDELSDRSRERLEAVVASHDGFKLAEKDLELRGAGNVFGTAQSGFPDFRFATPADVAVMKKARDWASWLAERDPDLSGQPLVKAYVRTAFDNVHFE